MMNRIYMHLAIMMGFRMETTPTGSQLNFYLNEYLEDARRRLHFIRDEGRYLLSSVRSQFQSLDTCSASVSLLIHRLGEMIAIANEIDSKIVLPFCEQPWKNVPFRTREGHDVIYEDLEEKISELETAYSYLLLALDQRFEGSYAENVLSLVPSKTEWMGTQKVSEAADVVFNDYIGRLNCPDLGGRTPLTVFGPSVEYEVSPLMMIAHIPNFDRYRCRYWSSLAHEAFHLSFRRLVPDIADLARHPKSHTLKLRDRLKNTITNFEEPTWVGLIKFRNDLEKEIYNIGVPYSGNFTAQHARRHFEEILADMAGLMLAGLGSYLAFSRNMPYLRHLGIAGQRYNRDLDHPPYLSRVRYMLSFLDKFLGYSDIPDFQMLRTNLYTLVGYDCGDPQFESHCDEYVALVERRFGEIAWSAHLFLRHPSLYDAQLWKATGEHFSRFMHQEEINADPREMLNFAWIRKLGMLEKSPRADLLGFLEWERGERKASELIVDHLSYLHHKLERSRQYA